MRIVKRLGDMGEGTKLELLQEDDGDIIVYVIPETHCIPAHQIQFCTLSGGGRSHKTWMALCELIKAINEDNEEAPQKWTES